MGTKALPNRSVYLTLMRKQDLKIFNFHPAPGIFYIYASDASNAVYM